MSEIESVAVVGGGFMGTGIAESAAVAGLPVIVRDVDEASLGRAEERIETSLARAVRGGKLDEGEARAVRGRIELTTELESIGQFFETLGPTLPRVLELYRQIALERIRIITQAKRA